MILVPPAMWSGPFAVHKEYRPGSPGSEPKTGKFFKIFYYHSLFKIVTQRDAGGNAKIVSCEKQLVS